MSTSTDITCPPTWKLSPDESTAATTPENLNIFSAILLTDGHGLDGPHHFNNFNFFFACRQGNR
jgi:hypothetical protein